MAKGKAKNKKNGHQPQQRNQRQQPRNPNEQEQPQNVPEQDEVHVITESEIRSEFVWSMFLPLSVFLFFNTPFIYLIYAVHFIVFFAVVIGNKFGGTSDDGFEMFSKRMLFPLMVGLFIPIEAALDAYFKLLATVQPFPVDATGIDSTAVAIAWKDGMLSVGLSLSLGIYLAFIYKQGWSNGFRLLFGSLFVIAMTGLHTCMYSVPAEHLPAMPVIFNTAALVVLVYSAIYLYIAPRLPKEWIKCMFAVFVVVAGIAVFAVHAHIGQDVAVKDSILEILNFCNFMLGVFLFVVPLVEMCLSS